MPSNALLFRQPRRAPAGGNGVLATFGCSFPSTCGCYWLSTRQTGPLRYLPVKNSELDEKLGEREVHRICQLYKHLDGRHTPSCFKSAQNGARDAGTFG